MLRSIRVLAAASLLLLLTAPLAPLAFGQGTAAPALGTAAQGRAALGAAAGNGVNLLDAKYGADPTGVANNDAALQSAVNDACNNASPISQTKEVYIPAGIYAFSPVALISITNACWIHGAGPLIGGTQGGTVLRVGVGVATDFLQYRAVGQLKVSDLRIDMSGGQQVGSCSYARVQAGGAGYAVNDTILLGGGTSTLGCTLRVTAVSAGAVTGVVIAVPGGYSIAPSPVAAQAQGSSSGAGAGATFNMIYAGAAAISIAGPATTLTANAASAATVFTVASCTGFLAGGAVEIEQDDGNYKVTTQVGACTANTLTTAAGLTFAAASSHRVYAKYTSNPLIDNVVIVGFWDGIRIDNASFVTVRATDIQDYSHDGLIKINGAGPINGGDRYQFRALDLNVGTSSAGVEVIAGGDVAIEGKSKFIGSNFSVLLNTYFTLTGTLQIGQSSLEEPLSCAVRLHQSVAAKEYHNIVIVGNEFSSLATSGQHFCVDVGTANTSPKWINLIDFSHNTSNSSVSAGVNMVQVLDGDTIGITGNRMYNNSTAGPNAIAVGGASTNVLEAGNTITGYPTGAYGTMQASSLVGFGSRGGLAAAGGLTAAPRNVHTCGMGPNSAAAAYTSQTPVTTEFYFAELFIPSNTTLTGLGIFNSATISGNVKVGLADSTGAVVATSASTAMAGVSVYQRVPFTATYTAVGPGTYYALAFYDNATVRPNTITAANCGVGKSVGQTYATGFTTIAAPTTFTTALAPVMTAY